MCPAFFAMMSNFMSAVPGKITAKSSADLPPRSELQQKDKTHIITACAVSGGKQTVFACEKENGL
jgi:hypothetical protein